MSAMLRYDTEVTIRHNELVCLQAYNNEPPCGTLSVVVFMKHYKVPPSTANWSLSLWL